MSELTATQIPGEQQRAVSNRGRPTRYTENTT